MNNPDALRLSLWCAAGFHLFINLFLSWYIKRQLYCHTNLKSFLKTSAMILNCLSLLQFCINMVYTYNAPLTWHQLVLVQPRGVQKTIYDQLEIPSKSYLCFLLLEFCLDFLQLLLPFIWVHVIPFFQHFNTKYRKQGSRYVKSIFPWNYRGSIAQENWQNCH